MKSKSILYILSFLLLINFSFADLNQTINFANYDYLNSNNTYLQKEFDNNPDCFKFNDYFDQFVIETSKQTPFLNFINNISIETITFPYNVNLTYDINNYSNKSVPYIMQFLGENPYQYFGQTGGNFISINTYFLQVYYTYPLSNSTIDVFNEELYQKELKNTIVHELTHSLEHTNLLLNLTDIFNMTINSSGILTNQDYYLVDIFNISEFDYNTTPYNLYQTYNNDLYRSFFFGVFNPLNGYDESQYAEEVSARIVEYCLEEVSPFNFKWQDYDGVKDIQKKGICSQFEFNQSNQDLYNNFFLTFLSSYLEPEYRNVRIYNEDTYDNPECSFSISSDLPQVGSDLSGFLSNISGGVVTTIFSLSFLGLLLILIGSIFLGIGLIIKSKK